MAERHGIKRTASEALEEPVNCNNSDESCKLSVGDCDKEMDSDVNNSSSDTSALENSLHKEDKIEDTNSEEDGESQSDSDFSFGMSEWGSDSGEETEEDIGSCDSSSSDIIVEASANSVVDEEKFKDSEEDEEFQSDDDYSSGSSAWGDSGDDSEEEIGFEDRPEGLNENSPGKIHWTENEINTVPLKFSKNSGLSVPIRGKQPIDIFRTLFTNEIIELTVTETNKYAAHLLTCSNDAGSRLKDWKPLNALEFLTWLGLILIMCYAESPILSWYWRKNSLGYMPIFGACMSYHRFRSILRCLKFTQNPTTGDQKPNDRFFKITPLLNFFNSIMDNLVIPDQNLCIEQPLILTKSRLIPRINFKEKKPDTAIRLYMLTQSSGLALRLFICNGSSDPDIGGHGHGCKVVRKLMEGKLDCGHSLFLDDYYIYVNLVRELFQRKTYVTGALRRERNDKPKAVSRKRVQKNEIFASFSDEGICVFKWKTSGSFMMITSKFGANMVDFKTSKGETIRSPEALVQHYHLMGDTDEWMNIYPLRTRKMKWHRKIGIHLFYQLSWNSFHIFKMCNPNSKLDRYGYLKYVASSLLCPAYNASLLKGATQSFDNN